MTLMLKILMTEITIPFSLYIACTNHQEYEKQFSKLRKYFATLNRLKFLLETEVFDIAKPSTVL